MASVKVIHTMIDDAVASCAPCGSGYDSWQRKQELGNRGKKDATPTLKRLHAAHDKARAAYEKARKALDNEIERVVNAEQKKANAGVAVEMKAWVKLRDEAASLKVDIALDPKAAKPVKAFLAKCRKA